MIIFEKLPQRIKQDLIYWEAEDFSGLVISDDYAGAKEFCANASATEVFDRVLHWNGIIGWPVEWWLDSIRAAQELSKEEIAVKQDAELALAASNLRSECGGHWSHHPEFPRDQWKQEVACGGTLLGYWEWVANAQNGEELEPQGTIDDG